MPKATFYTHVADPARFACRLAAKAAASGSRVLLWADDDGTLAQLDRDLWAEPPESFLPHEIWFTDEAMPQDVPLVLASGGHLPRNVPPVVLNISEQFWCDAPQPPERVLEIVGNSLEDLAAARERFKAYRARG
ncbi:MAG: DNA polymerase III subunit chi, partial [Neisseria sp.]|nr:DNA polymerase III subunit chi [Neisseria sp.]